MLSRVVTSRQHGAPSVPHARAAWRQRPRTERDSQAALRRLTTFLPESSAARIETTRQAVALLATNSADHYRPKPSRNSFQCPKMQKARQDCRESSQCRENPGCTSVVGSRLNNSVLSAPQRSSTNASTSGLVHRPMSRPKPKANPLCLLPIASIRGRIPINWKRVRTVYIALFGSATCYVKQRGYARWRCTIARIDSWLTP